MSDVQRWGIQMTPWFEKLTRAWMEQRENGDFVRYEDYARLKKQYDDLEYCQGHVPYAQHRSAVDKWTELFHKTADNFDKVVADYARLKAEVERLTKAGDAAIEHLRWQGGKHTKEVIIPAWNAAKEGKQP